MENTEHRVTNATLSRALADDLSPLVLVRLNLNGSLGS